MIQNTTISNAFLWNLKMAQTFCTLSDRWPSLPSAKYPPPEIDKIMVKMQNDEKL